MKMLNSSVLQFEGPFIVFLTENAPSGGYPLPPTTLHFQDRVEVKDGSFTTQTDGSIIIRALWGTHEQEQLMHLPHDAFSRINTSDGKPIKFNDIKI